MMFKNHELLSQDPDFSTLEKRLAESGRTWVGQDTQILKSQILYPDEVVEVETLIPEGGLPDLGDKELKFVGTTGLFQLSVRSKLAQCGLHVNSRRIKYGAHGNRLAILETMVLGDRPVQLDKGQGLARFYSTTGAHMLTGEELWKAILDQKVGIDGAFGRDWFLTVIRDNDFFTDDHSQIPMAVGIALKLKPVRFGIKYSQDPIKVLAAQNYRQYLDAEVFGELHDHAPFWVSETMATLHLPQGLTGDLNLAANLGSIWALQTSSPLIEGGKTDWNIRTEFTQPRKLGPGIIVPCDTDYANQHVIMHFYEDRS
jgi:hypothetical protein